MRPAPVVAAAAGAPPCSVHELPDAAIDLANRMFDLARRGDLSLLTYLQAGLPPNLTNNRGDTLLMLASYHGHLSLVEHMLHLPSSSGSKGSPDPNQLNGREQSILAGAVFKGHHDVARLLIQHGADPTAGQPSAEETARMFNKWQGVDGFRELFENAPGRGRGATEAAPPVEDREQVRRVPGAGLKADDGSGDPTPSHATES
ncbi:hypothetical protein ACQY0O_002150 [Thecaphora frezii]